MNGKDMNDNYWELERNEWHPTSTYCYPWPFISHSCFFPIGPPCTYKFIHKFLCLYGAQMPTMWYNMWTKKVCIHIINYPIYNIKIGEASIKWTKMPIKYSGNLSQQKVLLTKNWYLYLFGQNINH